MVSNREVGLPWRPATHPETDSTVYQVFRDGVHVAAIKGWSSSDARLVKQTEYIYQVSAINYHRAEGRQGAPFAATTIVDVMPPGVVSINNVCDRAGIASPVAPDRVVSHMHIHAAGLVKAWDVDENTDETAFGMPNYGRSEAVVYSTRPGPAWTTGRYGNGLQGDPKREGVPRS